MSEQPEVYCAENLEDFRISKELENQRAAALYAYSHQSFDDENPGLLKRSWEQARNHDFFIPAAAAAGGLLLGVAAAILLNEQYDKYQAAMPEKLAESPVAAPPATLAPESFPPSVGPEFKIDVNEIAFAHASMLDFSFETINQEGHLEPVALGGGALIERDGALYFATSRKVIHQDLNEPNTAGMVRITVPTGFGYELLEYVIDANEFVSPTENLDVVMARFLHDDEGKLLQAIYEQRISPLRMTGLYKGIGYTVIGSALEETPYLDAAGKVITRSAEIHSKNAGVVGFTSREFACEPHIRDGSFLHAVDDDGRITSEVIGVTMSVGSITDQHNEGSCVTTGTASMNANISST